MSESRSGGTPELNWNRVFRVWWLLAWRGLAGFILVGVIVGGAIRLAFGNIGASEETLGVIGSIFGLAVFAIWGMIVVRMALWKKYRDFDLHLTER